jgi:signal peptidase I
LNFGLRRLALLIGLVVIVAGAVAAYYTFASPTQGHVAYRVPSDAMLPTLAGGDAGDDTIRVDIHAYETTDPARCEVVVFEHPSVPGMQLVSRIVGLPGETVSIRDGSIWIGDRVFEIASPHGPIRYTNAGKLGVGDELAVPNGCYLVLSDNSAAAIDSRFFGPVPRTNLIGRAEKIIWPPTRARSLLPSR